MKMRVLMNRKGELIAATQGPVGSPEELASQAKAKKTEPAAFITLGPGQTVREVDVPDKLLDAAKADEFHKYVMEAVGR